MVVETLLAMRSRAHIEVTVEAEGDQHNEPPPASIITEMITLQTLCIVLQCTSYFTIEECLTMATRWERSERRIGAV